MTCALAGSTILSRNGSLLMSVEVLSGGGIRHLVHRLPTWREKFPPAQTAQDCFGM
jgi:hypothetical protein